MAAVITLSNMLTGALVGVGAWLLRWREQRQQFRQADREQDRIDRKTTADEWERLVGLYGTRIEALEQSERKCRRQLGRCIRELTNRGLIGNVDWDSDEEPKTPVPKPPEPPK